MAAPAADGVGSNRRSAAKSHNVQDQMPVELTLWEGEPIGIHLPPTVVLTVVETSPEIRGATASNSPKPAKMDTGLMTSVPPFIKQGERVMIRTEDGAYVGRAD